MLRKNQKRNLYTKKEFKNQQEEDSLSFCAYRVSFVAAGLFRLLYYNEKAFGVVGNVSNWSLGRTAWKKEGPTTLLKEHQCVCERELRQMLVFLPFAVSP